MGKKQGAKYKLHQESLGTQEDLHLFLNKIGDNPASLPIVHLSRRKALLELLTVHSELSFIHLKGGYRRIPDLNPELDERQSERLIQESLKWAIKWVFDFCNDKGESKSIKPSRKEVIEMLIFAYKYDFFRDVLFSASKGGYSIKLTNNRLEFIPENINHAFLAYNSWRQAYRERIQINNIQSTGIAAIKEVQSSEFTMPNTWDLGKYTLNEYKQFSVSLDELLSKWIKNHGTKNPKIVIGKYNSSKLVKIHHKNWWFQQISNISGLSQNTVKDIISDLTYSNIKDTDPAYQYFVPLNENELALSACFAGVFIRPERNLVALIPKMPENTFHQLTNDCEGQQISLIKQSLKDEEILIAEKKTKAQEVRPGMDILFLDVNTKELLVVELKWTASPSNTGEMYNVDNQVKKGLEQLQKAHEYVARHIDTILFEYFGASYKGVQPRDQEYCVAINESIGTGEHCDAFAHVVTLDHLIELLNKGVGYTINTLRNTTHRIPNEFYSEVPMNFELLGYDIHCSGTQLKGTWLDKSLPKLSRR
ncbi:hypothetical protein [Paenibacillus typhae]|uniref:Uncharacterized protein n=1 Tax=Paenibacillus typhae TaxID=1174501 RepID=A0A1G9HU19_9BACL|nr:hypothetical protein [Paenibacillus typhae]SDL16332.1 hypothetical protein SAMN05216192_1842 [Paenibacillus typhae]